jgi:FixJ family two-component response regulator
LAVDIITAVTFSLNEGCLNNYKREGYSLSERTTTIAIVDDDPAVRRGISGLLRSLGFAAVDFSSAEEFLNSGRATDMSCVITDVRMPGMSGVELQDRLIAAGHKIPVIFMTAFPEERTKTRAIKAGAFGFLTKPFAQNTLLDCVHSALRGS